MRKLFFFLAALALVPLAAQADNRVVVYPGQNPSSVQTNQTPRFTRLALGTFLANALGIYSQGQGEWSNLSASPATGLYVTLAPSASTTLGALYQVQQDDPNPVPSGSWSPQLAADPTLAVIEGQQATTSAPIGPLTAPGSGSVYWLIEGQLQTVATDPQSQLFVSSAGTRSYQTVDGLLTDEMVYQAISGTPGASPTPPAVTSGWVGIATVLVPAGVSQVTSGMIAPYAAQQFAGFLTSANAIFLQPSPSPAPQSGNAAITGTFAASAFYGNGSGLTGIPPGALSSPVPISLGGTGTSSPNGVTCGASGNMVCGGAFPNQTIDVTQNPSFRTVTASASVTSPLFSGDSVTSHQPVFNAAAYGTLDPTGTNDSSTAIEAALNACHTAGGGIVYVPANAAGGTAVYKIANTTLTPYSNCWLIGAGRDLVTLRLANTNIGGVVYDGNDSNLSNIKISGFTFDEDSQLYQAGVLIEAMQSNDIRVTDSRFINLNQGHAVALGTVLDAPGCSNSGCAGPTLGYTAGGTLGATTYYVKVTYLDAQGGQSQQGIEGSIAVPANNVLTVGCPTGSLGSQVYATNCLIYVSTSSGTETLQNPSTTVLTGTVWTMPTSGLIAGQAFSGYSAYMSHVLVADNHFSGGTMGGAEPAILIATQYADVRGNVFRGYTSTSPDPMLALYAYDDNAIVHGNFFDDTPLGSAQSLSTELLIEEGVQYVTSYGNRFLETSQSSGSIAIGIVNSQNITSIGDVMTTPASDTNAIGVQFSGDFSGPTFDTTRIQTVPNSNHIRILNATITGGTSYAQVGDSQGSATNHAQSDIIFSGGSYANAAGYGVQIDAADSTGMQNISVSNITFGQQLGGATIAVTGASGKPFSNVHFDHNTFLQTGYYPFYLDGTNASDTVSAIGNDFTNMVPSNEFDLVNGATVNIGGVAGTTPIAVATAQSGTATVSCPTCVTGITAGSNIVVGSGTTPSVAVTAAPAFVGASTSANGSGSGSNTTQGVLAPCFTSSGTSCVNTQHALHFAVSIPSSPAPYTCNLIATGYYECTDSDQTWQTLTLSGAAIFSSTTSYHCTGIDVANSGAQPVFYGGSNVSASSVKMIAPPFLSTASSVTTGGTLEVSCSGS